MSLSDVKKKIKFLNHCLCLINNIIKYEKLTMQFCSHCVLSEQECIVSVKSNCCSVCMWSDISCNLATFITEKFYIDEKLLDLWAEQAVIVIQKRKVKVKEQKI